MDEDELLKAIQRLPNKQCASDPIPTWLLKKISGMILPFVKVWFKNYLSDRSFNVRRSGTKSDFIDYSVSVPQGSVLGPLLFSLYTGDLEKIVMKYKLGFHKYADDTQIYGHCNNEGTEELQMKVSEGVDEIASLMGANCLKLNSEKTEVIWFSSRRNLKNIPSYSVRVLESNIFPSKFIRNLGIYG